MEILLQADGCTARVDTMGGELVAYQDQNGLDYMWSGDAAYWAGRSPLLFPAIGALQTAGVCFEGVRYPLERHGFARRRVFTLSGQGTDWVELTLLEDAGSLSMYPYPFLLQVRHSLVPGGFSTAITVTATGDKPMPFTVGGHPAFRCPLTQEESFEAYEICFDEAEHCPTLVPQNGVIDRACARPWLENADRFPLRHSDFDQMDTIVLEGLRSAGVTLRSTKTGRGVRMDCADFPVLALWSMPGKAADYLCIEPWHGLPHVVDEGAEFAQKSHCITLQPGEHRTLTYTVTTLPPW